MSKKLFLSIISTLLMIIMFSREVNAQTILKSDNFDDYVDDGWTRQHESGIFDYSNYWTFKNGMYGLTINSPFTVENSFFGDNEWTDYQVDFDMYPISGSDKNFIFRYQDRSLENTYNRWYEIHISGIEAHLSKLGFGDIAPAKIAIIQHGIVYNWKASLAGNHIIIQYKKNSENEYKKLFDVYDLDDPILNGKIGIRIGTGVTHLTEIYFDNIVVSDLREYLHVPHMSQIDPLWSDDIYDNAPAWAESNSVGIKNWGCALTSAAMVLNFHGHQTDPKSLNQYLIDNNGYNSWGGVIWSYFTKYARENINSTPDLTLKDLEFTYPEYSDSQLISDIQTNQPDIIKLLINPDTGSNHFIVAIGPTSSSSSIFIQDPANLTPKVSLLEHNYSNKTSLRLARFTPSMTDLSYLWIYGQDSLLKLSVTKNDQQTSYQPGIIINQIPNSDIFIDGAIKNLLSENTSPQFLSFNLPKPTSGLYKINFTGKYPGFHTIDMALFDQSANDFRKTISLFSGPDIARSIDINYDAINIQNTNYTLKSSIPIIQELTDYGYNQKMMTKNVHKHIVHMLGQIAKHLPKKHGNSSTAMIRALTHQLQVFYAKGLIQTDIYQALNKELMSL